MVVGIDRLGVGHAAVWVKRLGGGQQRFDGFVAENDQGGHRPEAAGERFVVAGVADAGNGVLAAKLLQIIGGVARAGLWVAGLGGGAQPRGGIGGGGGGW